MQTCHCKDNGSTCIWAKLSLPEKAYYGKHINILLGGTENNHIIKEPKHFLAAGVLGKTDCVWWH